MENNKIDFTHVHLQWFGGSKAPVYASGNIDNATRNLGNTVNTAVTSWNKSNDFIVAIAIEAALGANMANTNCRIEWRNKTDSGTFAVLGSSGELVHGATNLVDGNSLDSGEAICTPVNGTTYVAGSPNGGVEKEGAATFTLGDGSTTNQWSEIQISVSGSANGHDGDEYEFQAYDVDNSAALGPSLATITFAAAGTTYYKSIAGSITPGGSLFKKISIGKGGTINFSGDLFKKISTLLNGDLSFVGNIIKKGFISFGGAISFVGNLNAGLLKIISLSGSLSFSGGLSKNIKKFFGGSLNFSGAIIKKTALFFTGSLNFVGSTIAQKLGALYYKTITGSLSFTGSISKNTKIILSGSLNFAGAIVKKISKNLSGSLSFVGNIIAQKLGALYYKSLSGTINFSGGLFKNTKKILNGSLNFSGSIIKKISKTFSGALGFIGNLTKYLLGEESPKIIEFVSNIYSKIEKESNLYSKIDKESEL